MIVASAAGAPSGQRREDGKRTDNMPCLRPANRAGPPGGEAGRLLDDRGFNATRFLAWQARRQTLRRLPSKVTSIVTIAPCPKVCKIGTSITSDRDYGGIAQSGLSTFMAWRFRASGEIRCRQPARRVVLPRLPRQFRPADPLRERPWHPVSAPTPQRSAWWY